MPKLNIKTSQLFPLGFYEGVPALLVDGDITTKYFTGWNSISYPSKIMIDLLANHQLEKIRLYDTTGVQTYKIYTGSTPFNTVLLTTLKTDAYNVWRDIVVTKQARYIIFEMIEAKQDYTPEIEIYGTILETISSEPIEQKKLSPTAFDIMGCNGFHWIPSDRYSNFSIIRQYHDIPWTNTSDNKYVFDPGNGGAFDGKKTFTETKANGVKISLCIQQRPVWLKNVDATRHDRTFKPKLWNASASLPASYKEQAQVFFQYSARYGSNNAVPTNLLNIKTDGWNGNQVLSGLNLVDYIEVDNEVDKWWQGTHGYFTPYEYASYLSAVYDGHEGSLGNNVGIKTADPKMKVAMAGLAKLDIKYIQLMMLWFKYNRKDGKFPCDVLNFHDYSNNGTLQGNSTKGVSPEDGKLKEKLKEIVKYRNQYLPDTEIWISEFGYDTNNSTQQSIIIGNLDKDDVQGIWLVRSYLEIMASGVDKAMMYNLCDESGVVSTGSELYTMSGMITSEHTEYKKKKSWYYVDTLNRLFKGTDYKIVSDVIENGVYKYGFKNSKNEELYFIWLPTAIGATKTYNFEIIGKDVKKLTFVNNGVEKSETYTGSSFTVSEIPTIFKVTEKSIIIDPIEDEDDNDVIDSSTAGSGSNQTLEIKGDLLINDSKLSNEFKLKLQKLMLEYKVSKLDFTWFKW